MFDSRIVCCYLYTITKYGYPPPAAGTLKYLEEMHALGFQSVELEGIRETHLLEMFDLRFKIKAKINALNLTVPYFCVVLPGLAAAEKSEREQNLALFEKGCEIAHLLGANGVLDNGPLPPYAFPQDIPVVRHYDEKVLQMAGLPENFNWQNYWQELVETFRQACDLAAEYDLTYQLHPCLGVLTANTDAFLYFYDAVGRDNLRFNLDTANQFVIHDNLVLALHRINRLVDYIHLSDNRGTHVEHLPPGSGAIHWESFFTALDVINFKGQIGLDLGGAETVLENLDKAYRESAGWLEQRVGTV